MYTVVVQFLTNDPENGKVLPGEIFTLDPEDSTVRVYRLSKEALLRAFPQTAPTIDMELDPEKDTMFQIDVLEEIRGWTHTAGAVIHEDGRRVAYGIAEGHADHAWAVKHLPTPLYLAVI